MIHQFLNDLHLERRKIKEKIAFIANLFLSMNHLVHGRKVGSAALHGLPVYIPMDLHHLNAILSVLKVDVTPPHLLYAVSPSCDGILHDDQGHFEL